MSALTDDLLILGVAAAVIVPSAALAFLIARAVAGKDNALLAALIGVAIFIVSVAGICWLILYAMCSGMTA